MSHNDNVETFENKTKKEEILYRSTKFNIRRFCQISFSLEIYGPTAVTLT